MPRAPSSPSSSGKPVAPADAVHGLRERILEASVDLIEREGLQALSMREVARRSGVTHQAPYHHFRDREAILAAICEAGFRELDARLTEAMRDFDDAPLLLEQAGQAYVRFALERTAHFRVMFRPELVSVDTHPELEATAEGAFGKLPALAAACARAGLPMNPSAESMVVMLWSVVHGLACLLTDGPLERKVPNAGTARDKVVADTMRSVRSLMEAALAHHASERRRSKRAHRKRPTKAPPPRTRVLK